MKTAGDGGDEAICVSDHSVASSSRTDEGLFRLCGPDGLDESTGDEVCHSDERISKTSQRCKKQ